jgi:hypothetical protein
MSIATYACGRRQQRDACAAEEHLPGLTDAGHEGVERGGLGGGTPGEHVARIGEVTIRKSDGLRTFSVTVNTMHRALGTLPEPRPFRRLFMDEAPG